MKIFFKPTSFLVATLFLIASHFIVSCDSNEKQNLRKENERLKQEIARLKETADYHFQQGVGLISQGKYEEAKLELEMVVNKYPAHPLVSEANKQLKIVKKEIETQKEKSKYLPKSPEEAINEWLEFRNNADTYQGTVTTWRFQVSYISNENPLGYLDSATERGHGMDYAVVILGPEYYTYSAAALFGKVPIIREKDWVVITGKFKYVSSDNVIALSPIRIKNEGYK